MWSATSSPRIDGGPEPPAISPAGGAWPRLLATALIEAIARQVGARMAALSVDELVCWPPCELTPAALSTLEEAAAAVARRHAPVVIDTDTPSTIVAAPLPAGDGSQGSPGSLVVAVTPAAGADHLVAWVEALACQAAAALENARRFELCDPPAPPREPSAARLRDCEGRPGQEDGSPNDRMSVVVVDRHRIVREGLRSVLESEGASVVGEAGSAPVAHEVVRRSEPDVVLLDLELGHAGPKEGLDLCRQISERFPAVGVVVLTASQEQSLVLDALRRGARGCVIKDSDVAGLLRVIRAVKSGESALDSHSAAAVVRSFAAGTDPRRPELSARELEVVRLVARGRTNRQIGEACFISESTVKFHVRRAMTKLGAHHRAEVAYAAGHLGLI